MIASIKIQNFILIDNLELNFSPGLNIITGETGSGKSMLISALILLFGERAGSDYVRYGENKALIEAILLTNNSEIINLLKENDIEIFESEIIIRREISSKGNTRNFINDSPVNLNTLKRLGELFIDFHGQHDHQALLNPENHIKIFDRTANYLNLLNEYSESYNLLKEKVSEFNSLKSKEKSLLQKIDYQRFTLDEINKTNPLENEDSILEKELNIAQNAEKIFVLTNEIFEKLYNDDSSAFTLLSSSMKNLNELSEFDISFREFQTELEASKISMKEIASAAKSYSDAIEFNPQKIEEIRSRLYQLKLLQKKYGSLNDILELKAKIELELSLIDNFDFEIDNLKIEIKSLQKKCGDFANKLSSERKNFALVVEKNVIDNLENMGIANAGFKVQITNNIVFSKNEIDSLGNIDGKFYSLNQYGIDELEFLISTNKGEVLKSLSEVASGGEISRVMLSLKSLVAKSDTIDTMVFDEIDNGISGRIAQKVGLVMDDISKYRQIIAITHLPQIAALGDINVSIEKKEINERAISSARILNDEEKLYEIAKMLSGDEITEAGLQSAVELIKIKTIS
jgi:DNA repair protein RecN (Recombination protein N)